MREKLIGQLGLPRDLVRRYQDLGRCPHNGMYDGKDIACLECEDQTECEWLYNNNEFSNLKQKSLTELLKALGFAMEFVSAQAVLWEHDSRDCGCETCSWLRETAELYDEVSGGR